MTNTQQSDGLRIQRLSRLALGLGLVLALPCLYWLTRDSVQFARSYLVAFLFTLAPAGGALALLALHRLTGGRWGDALSEILPAAARTLPFIALLFVPLLFWLDAIYPWAAPGWAESEAATQHKVLYLDTRFFIARAVVYFAVWSWLARVTLSPTANAESNRSRARGAVAVLVYVFTMSLAAFDWGMSLGPEWYSTMYGLIIILGQLLSALTLAIILRWVMDQADPERRLATDVYHDLGTLLFAFVMTWAYMGFSQFLIIWSANLPEEVTWYMERLAPGWKYLATAIVALHFAMPFTLLLMRKVKRKSGYLAGVAALLLATRLPELIWIIVPGFHPEELRIHWLDVVLPLAMLCLWSWLVLGALHRRLASSAPPRSTPETTAAA